MGVRENLKKRRLVLGFTLEELGKMIGVTKPTMQKYESGVIKLSSDKIEQLAEVLKTTPAQLMNWSLKDYDDNNNNNEDYTFFLKKLIKLINYEIVDMGNSEAEPKLLLVDNEKGYKITKEDFNELIQDNMKYLKGQILLLESKYKE